MGVKTHKLPHLKGGLRLGKKRLVHELSGNGFLDITVERETINDVPCVCLDAPNIMFAGFFPEDQFFRKLRQLWPEQFEKKEARK